MSEEARRLALQAPSPAIVGNILFGTAGWTDPSLIKSKRFYPRGTSSSADRLAFYASQFSMVEVDATYYAIPAPSVAQRWVERTPDTFVFDIKAHPVFTGHPIDRRRLPRDLANAVEKVRPERPRLYPAELPRQVKEQLELRFLDAIEPVARSGKLGCVMVQLPPWETATRGAARRLERLRYRLPGVRLAVEFRHPSWLESSRQQRVFDLLRRNELAYVCVDEPNVPGGGVQPVVTSTHDDLAVVRFHGHNIQGWHPGASVAERFDYLYAPNELQPWTIPIRRLADQAREVHTVFNNCVQDFAVVNARDLAALLSTALSTTKDSSQEP